MHNRKSVSVKQVLADIGSGATEFDLQGKYDITPRGLEKLFKRLVAEKHIGKMPLIKRYPKYEAKLVHIRARRNPRSRLEFALPAYDLSSQTSGLVRDVSESGLRVAGMRCKVGELKSLQIQWDRFMNVDPLLLLARCRWRKTRGKKRRYVTGGFEIKVLPKGGKVLLKKLVDLLALNPSLELSSHAAEEKRRSAPTSYPSDYVVHPRVRATSSHESKENTRALPNWVDLDAMKALQEIYRSGALHEILGWWEAGKNSKEGVGVSRPWCSYKRRFVWVHLNEDILHRALKKVRQQETVGYEALSQLIEQLLWEFVGRPKDVLEKRYEHEWK